MAEESRSSEQLGWLEATGLLHIFRVLGFAVHPAKLVIALVAIILTFASGGVLDLIWKTRGGVDEFAIARFVAAAEAHEPYEEPEGDFGIFQVWQAHEGRCIRGVLHSCVPGESMTGGAVLEFLEARQDSGLLRNLLGMGYGVWWLLTQHFFYFIIFAIDVLLIWSWGGGAICRIAALEFARGEKLSMKQAHGYAMKHLIGGFAMAPCVPVIGMVIVVALMIIGGMVLRIPVLGDLLAGTAFPLAILGGFIITILLIGLLIGGSLFWPAVAAEGQDAYDAFSRGLSYAFSRPWKTVLYAAIALIFAGICWLLVNMFTLLGLNITRGVVAFGTSPFGWWPRGSEGDPVGKMELLWAPAGADAWYSWPTWSQLTWYEHYSGFVVGLCILLVIALMWAFLASFYLCSSTVIYFLLRRDVDKTDLEDVNADEEEEVDIAAVAEPPAGAEQEREATAPEAGQPPDEPKPDDANDDASFEPGSRPPGQSGE
ncbi:MAG: hypothetical protein ACYTFA_18105 [Planctomycetota bacterium]|jgi:hypothetical protein